MRGFAAVQVGGLKPSRLGAADSRVRFWLASHETDSRRYYLVQVIAMVYPEGTVFKAGESNLIFAALIRGDPRRAKEGETV